MSLTTHFHAVQTSEVKVAHSCPALCDPMDYTVHKILQARTLEWVAAGDQPRLIQGVRSGDGVREDQDTIASIRY